MSEHAENEKLPHPVIIIVSHVEARDDAREEPDHATPLYQANSGFHAYAYLASAALIELLVWSIPFSFGVFLNFYKNQLFPSGGTGRLAIVGTLSSGLMYMLAPVWLRIAALYPHRVRYIMLGGFLLVLVGMIGAAFATKDWHFILSQGIAYAFGGGLLYYTSTSLIFEWYPDRQGLAIGMLYSATGIGGIAMPFAIEALLHRFNQRLTFVILACIFTVVILPCFVFVKPRFSHWRRTDSSAFVNASFVRNPVFWCLLLCNTLQGLANFVPGIYLPTYASDLGFSATMASLTAALINGASVPGAILIGWASDKYNIRVIILASTTSSAAAVFLLWGLSNSVAALLVFATLFGFTAGGRILIDVASLRDHRVDSEDSKVSNAVFSLMGASRGIGNVLAGPISAALLAKEDYIHFGSLNYGPLILFTGSVMLASTVGAFHRA
ncbi:MFS general substrate transporter [Auricularia subglabra TFB-10046 SS5]|nr:MFS general substrate transporter [Auricularia subglabra TFB-10046 SS5]